MLTANVATTFRKRKRRYTRLPGVTPRDPRPVRYVVLPAPGMRHATVAPDAPWTDRDDLAADLGQATWEDAEWR